MITHRIKKAFLVPLCACLSLFSVSKADEIKSESWNLAAHNPGVAAVLELSDGLPGCMNGQKIRANKQWTKQLREMVYGIKKPNGQHVGLYLFQGGLCSVAELAELETLAMKDGLVEMLAELAAVRETVKQDFDVKVEPFSEAAKGFKSLIFMLIEESCRLRGRHSSFLLTWGKVEDNDRQLFHDKMRSFADLKEFFEDMIHFLADLEHSCPKGRAQYEEMLRLYKEQKHQQAAGRK